MPGKTKAARKASEEQGNARIKADHLKVIDNDGHLLHLTDDNFKEARDSHELLVVDFWAEWCGPCRMFGPVLEKFAKAHSGEVAVGKMDVDENNVIPTEFGVESIPSIVFFKNGKAMAMIVGAVPQAQLETVLADVRKKESG